MSSSCMFCSKTTHMEYSIYIFPRYKNVCFPYIVHMSQMVISGNGNYVGIEDIQCLETERNFHCIT